MKRWWKTDAEAEQELIISSETLLMIDNDRLEEEDHEEVAEAFERSRHGELRV